MGSLRWVFAMARPYRKFLFLAMFSSFVSTAFAMVPPLIVKQFVNEVLIAHKTSELGYLILLGFIAMTIKGFTNYAQAYLSETYGQSFLKDLRNQCYHQITNLSYRYYDQAETGQLMGRLAGDMDLLRMALSDGFTLGTQVVFTFFFVLISVLYLNLQLGLFLLLSFPVLFYLTYRFDHRVRPAFRKIREEYSSMTTILSESIGGVRVVKAFAQEPREEERFLDVNTRFWGRNVDASRIWAKFFPAFELVGGIYAVFVFIYGGDEVLAGTLSLGAFVAISAYVVMLVQPLRTMGQVLNFWEQSITSSQRLHEFLLAENEIKDGSKVAEHVRGDVRFNHVSFFYEKGSLPAVHDINLDIKAGRSVAILGATGAGKSTLCYLLGRFYDVTGGSIQIDGVDLREMRLDDLRRQVGFVLQESFLFSATISENIAFGKPNAAFEEIEWAARLAQADEFIKDMPQGYQTVVGERGVGLSGGQRQRIAIARAILTNPPILVLDDATASVDLETESRIQQGMKQLMQGRTSLVIAHRVSTLKGADEIIVLDHGRITERGTHKQLYVKNGVYRRIFDAQFKDREIGLGGIVS